MAQGSHTRRHDRGFTLVELTVVIAIIGILSVALSGGIITLLKTSPLIQETIGENHDEQQVVNYFYADVRSTPNVDIGGVSGAGTGYTTSSGPGCSAGEGERKLLLTWQVSSELYFRADYRLVGSGDQRAFERYFCSAADVASLPSGTTSQINVTDRLTDVSAADIDADGVVTVNLTRDRRTLVATATLHEIEPSAVPAPTRNCLTSTSCTFTWQAGQLDTNLTHLVVASTGQQCTVSSLTCTVDGLDRSVDVGFSVVVLNAWGRATTSLASLPATTTTTSTTTTTTAPAATTTTTTAPATTTTSTASTTTTSTTSTTVGNTPFNPLSSAQDFQILTEGNATINLYTVPGAVAVGGNLGFANYQSVAASGSSSFKVQSENKPTNLVVGGYVDLSASSGFMTVSNGYVHTGSLTGAKTQTFGSNVHVVRTSNGATDNYSTPRVVVAEDQSNQSKYPIVTANAFPFSSAFAKIRTSSLRLGYLSEANCPAIATPSLTNDGSGNYTLGLVNGKVNILNLTVAQVNAISNMSSANSLDSSTTLVVNITDSGSVSMPTKYWSVLQNGAKTSILWNFPNAISVSASNAFSGTMLAPHAAVSLSAIQLQGDLVAKTITAMTGDISLNRWTTVVPCVG